MLDRTGAPGLGWPISYKQSSSARLCSEIIEINQCLYDVSATAEDVPRTEKPVAGPEPFSGLPQTSKVLVSFGQKEGLIARCANIFG